MASFIERTDDGFALQLNNFDSKIGGYATTLGVTTAELDQVAADNEMYSWTIAGQNQVQPFAQNFTNFKILLRYGNGSEVITGVPTVPTLGTAPALVPANVQGRFSKLVARIKASPNYTKTIGEDLGIEVPDTPFDPQLGKPTFKIAFSSGGHPNLIWVKGKFQGVEIWVKRTPTGTWEKLDRDFSPDYIDKTALPAAGVSAVWNYKMIYIYKDEIVGNWSDEATVTVQGSV